MSVSGQRRCANCGADLGTDVAAALRMLDEEAARIQRDLLDVRRRQYDLSTEQRLLAGQQQQLEQQLQLASSRRGQLLARLVTAPPVAMQPPPPSAPLPPTAPLPPPPRVETLQPPPVTSPVPAVVRRRRRTEWGTATLGNILLGLGTILLTIAALVFATVTWQTLTEAQRALVLLGVTVICGAGTALLHRRLRNTAEAFGVLFVAFVVIDWYALRRAGVAGSIDVALWWSLGLAIGAGVSMLVWFTLAMRVQRVLSPMLASASAVVLAVYLGDTPTSPAAVTAVLLAVVASLAVVVGSVLDASDDWRPTAITFDVAAALVDGLVAFAALGSLADDGAGLASGIAIAAVGLAPATARAVRADCRGNAAGVLLEIVTSVALILAVVVGAASSVDGGALLAIAALSGLGLVLFAAYGPKDLSVGPAITALGTLGITAVGAFLPVLAALTAPLALLGHIGAGLGIGSALDQLQRLAGRQASELTEALHEPWAAVVLACIGIAAVIGWAPYRGRPRPVSASIAYPIALASAAAAVLITPMTLGAPVWVVVVVDLLAAAALLVGTCRIEIDGRVDAQAITGTLLAAGLAGSGLLWALLDPWLQVLALALVLLGAALAAARTRLGWQRSGAVVVAAVAWVLLGPATAVAADAAASVTALALTGSGAAAVLVASYGLTRAQVEPWGAWLVGLTATALGLLATIDHWEAGPWAAVAAMVTVAVTAALDAVAHGEDRLRRGLLGTAVGAAAIAAGMAVSAAGAPAAWGGATSTAAAAFALVASVHLQVPRPADRYGLIVGSGVVLLTAPLVALGGWPTAEPWAAVTAVGVLGVAALAVAPGARTSPWRAVTVGGGAFGVIVAGGMATASLGADQSVVGVVLSVAGAVAMVLATWTLRSGDAELALVQRVAAVIAGAVASGIGVLLAFVGTSLLATEGGPAQGWTDTPWRTVVALGVLGLGAAVASWRTPEEPLRATLLAIGVGMGSLEPGLVIAAAGAAAAWAAVGVVAAGSAILVLTAWLPRRAGPASMHRAAAASVAALAMGAGLVASLDGWASAQHRWATISAIALVAGTLAAILPRTEPPSLAKAILAAGAALAIVDAGLATSAAGGTTPQAALASALLAGALLAASPFIEAGTRPWHDPARDPDAAPALSPLLPVTYAGMLLGLLIAIVGEPLVTAQPLTELSGWSTEPWVTVAVVAALVVTPLVALRRTSGDTIWGLHLTTASAALIAEAGIVPAAASAPIGIVALCTTGAAGAVLVGGSIGFGRKMIEDVASAVGALGLVVGTAMAPPSWSARPSLVVATTAAAAVATTAASVVSRRTTVRPWLLAAAGFASMVTAGLVGPAADVAPWTAGLGIGVAGGMALVLACHVRFATPDTTRPLEVVSVIGLVVGVLVAWSDVGAHPSGLAITLTALVPLLALAGLPANRLAYRWASAGVALAASWSWCWVGDVAVPEAYTLPAAALALAAGIAAQRRALTTSSWLLYGPALLLALAPSLALALTDGGVLRPLVLTTGAAIVVLVGVWQRLQAPIVLGAVTIVVLAVDTLWPVADRAPRWIVFAVAGLLFLWLGATIERRLRQFRQLRDSFGHLH